MAVLILDSHSEKEAELLADAVEDRRREAIVCDVTDWPSGEPLTMTANGEGAVFGSEFDYEDVTGAYVNCHRLFRPYQLRFRDQLKENFAPTLNQLREYRGMFDGLCRILDWHGIDVLPHPRNHYWQEQKPWQLYLYDAIDVPVPDTLFTNDPAEVQAFYEHHDRVVFKPVTRGTSPHVMTDEDVTEQRLEGLATAPVQFQEYVEGEDLRIYVLNGEVVGAIRYESDNFSFKVDLKEGQDIHVEAATLADDIADTATTAAEQARLTYAAADVRRRPDGTHALLELNESPVFSPADTETGQDVSGALAEHLVAG